jgi:hypothetical protein
MLPKTQNLCGEGQFKNVLLKYFDLTPRGYYKQGYSAKSITFK